MKVERNQKIHLVCSKDETREVLQNIHFDGKHLTATNGHILVSIEAVNLPDDKPGLIPAEAYKTALKLSTKKVDSYITINDEKITVANSENKVLTFIQKIPIKEYPNFPAVFPDHWKTDKPILTISLNAELLYKIQPSPRKNKTFLPSYSFSNCSIFS